MIKEIFEEQRQYITHYFDAIDSAKAEEVFEACLNCKGLILFTGVGKSGIIAEKIAMTFVSTGTKALYLPPTNFLHGDIGILTSQDLLVMLSKSGETEELLNLLPFARRRGATLISLVSNDQSRLARECHLSVTLPVEKELCPFDLAPTTSAEVQLLFGDLLAVALMRAKNFSLSDYALNHPAGSIGKKMILTVEDLMFKDEDVPCCSTEARVIEVLVELSNKKCGCLLVTDPEKRLLGIFTDGDLRRALQTHGQSVLELKIEQLMTRSPSWVNKDLLAYDAIKLMQKDPRRWVTVLPVIEPDKKVVGIIRMHDIINAGIS
jgi:arabinose-5-phosphate isomerase